MPDERAATSQAASGVTLPEELSHWLRVQKSGVPAGLCLLIAQEIRDNGQSRTRPLRQLWIAAQLGVTDTTIRTAMRALEEIGALFSREEREGFVFWFGNVLSLKTPPGSPDPESAEAPVPGALLLGSPKSHLGREAKEIETLPNQPAKTGRSHCSTDS